MGSADESPKGVSESGIALQVSFAHGVMIVLRVFAGHVWRIVPGNDTVASARLTGNPLANTNVTPSSLMLQPWEETQSCASER